MSVSQPPGDVISPSTHMNNNTNAGLFVYSEPGGLTQQQAGVSAAFGMQPEDGSGSNQHLVSMPDQQQHDAGHSSMMHPAAAPGGSYGRSDMLAGLGGLHEQDPLHPDTDHLSSHPLMLTTADSLLSQGSTDLCGLGDGFDVEGEAQQQHHAGGSSFGTAAAATRISIDMQDVLNPGAGLPGVHSGSPQLHAGSHSPGLSHFGGSGHTASMQHGGEAYTAESLKSQQQQNGAHYGSLAPPPQQQQHTQQQQQQQRQSSQAQQRQGYSGSARASSSAAAAAAAAAGGGGEAPAQPVFRSQYRGVSYDKKKRKWRVQIKVAALGKSGVSVGYFDTEDAAARAYDRAAIGLLGRQNCKAVLNFPIEEYDNDSVPELVGKSREEVKATLKSERAKLPRRRLTHRRRTSRFLGVGSSNRKNQWQARILYHGKVTHLGYYRTEEEAARVYDKVSISLHGAGAQTNFPIDQYKHEVGSLQQKLSGLTREELQRALGVKPMDKSSRYRGVSKKKGRWEAKVMLNRKWAYREMFDTEADAARAYDTALWRLKPREARNYANFKDTCPPDVEEMLATLEKDTPLALHPTGLPLTAKPLIDAGLLYDDEGQSIKAPNGLTRSVSIGDLISVGDSAGQSVSEEPSAGNGSAGRHPLSGDGASGGAVGAVAGAGAGAAEGISSMARPGPAAAGMGGLGGMVKSASYSALSGLDGAVTSSLATATDPAAAAAAPVPLGSLPPSARGALRGELTHVHLQPVPGDPFGQHQQQHMGSSFGQQHRGMTRVQSVPQLRTYGSDAGSPTLPPMSGGGGGSGGAHGSGIQGLPSFGSVGGSGYGGQYEQQQWMGGSMGHPQHQHQQQMQAFGQGQSMQGSSHMALKAESAYWAPELSYPLPDHSGYHQQQHQQQQQHHGGMRASRSCGNLAFMAGGGSGMNMAGIQGPGSGMHHGGSHVASPPGSGGQPYGGSSSGGGAPDFAGESKPLMVRVGSEQHLLNPNPNPPGGFKGMSRIASESHLASMVPLSPGHGFLGPDRGLLDAPAGFGGGGSGGGGYQQLQPAHGMHGYGASSHGGYVAPFGGMPPYSGMAQQGGQHQHQHQHQHQQQQVMYGMGGGQQADGYALSSSPGAGAGSYMQQAGMQQLQPGSMHISLNAPTQGITPTGGMPPLSPVRQQQQQQAQQQQAAAAAAAAGAGCGRVFRTSSSGGMHRAHSAAALESIDETSVFRLQGMRSDMEASGQLVARGHSLPGSLGALPPGSGHPVSASGAYLAQQQQQQQQQQHGGMVPSGGGFGGGLPPISSALPVPQEHSHQHQQQHHHHQQQQYGQGMMGGGGFGGPSASAMHMTQAGAGGPGSSSGSMHCGGSSMGPAGSAGAASAAAAAAAFDAMSGGHDKWDVLGGGRPVAPDSPLGVVQIGGEELDVTMTFLTDHSPGHLGGPDDGLDITGLLTDPSSMRPPSPPFSNTTSALLFSDQAGARGGPGAAAGDTAIKMDE